MKRKVSSLLTALILMISLTSAAFAATAFSDISANPYKNEINYCQAKGYVTGVSPTTFSPDTVLTRGQLAVAWCRFMGYRTSSSLTDITPLTPRSYYDVASFLLYCTGAMNGTSATKFSPDGNITREMLAVIVARSMKLAASDPDAYKDYKDYAAIAPWAAASVSACLNPSNNILRGLYDGDNFEPGKAVTRAELCKVIYNIDKPMHTVTVGPLTGGTITATPTSAHAGETITLTINPDSGKQLVDGSLKYNGTAITGTAFMMPTTDVLITAQFEDIPTSPSPSESPSPSPDESPSPSPDESPSPA